MTRILSTIAAAAFAFGAAATVAQADMKTMMDGYAACNASYAQCLKGASDMTMASTPAEGMAKMEMNMKNNMACGEQLRACFSSVQ